MERNKTIITQDGVILNFGNLTSIAVEPVEIEDENESISSEYGLVAYDNRGADTLIFHDETIDRVLSERDRLIKWLQQEAFSTFTMNGGEE